MSSWLRQRYLDAAYVHKLAKIPMTAKTMVKTMAATTNKPQRRAALRLTLCPASEDAASTRDSGTNFVRLFSIFSCPGELGEH